MHVLSSHELDPDTVYKYKVATVTQKDTKLYSDVFEIHTPTLKEQSKSFRFIATGDMVKQRKKSMNHFLSRDNSSFLIGSCKCSIITSIQ